MSTTTTEHNSGEQEALRMLELATRRAAFAASLPVKIDLEHGNGTPAEVVLAIRRDLKAAVAAGFIPAHARFSVRRRDYNSILVELVAWSGQVLSEAYHAHLIAGYFSKRDSRVAPIDFNPDMRAPGRESEGCDARASDEINDVMRLVGFLVNRHNYNHSDPGTDHFDVGFYQTISARSVIAMAEQGIATELDPKLDDLRRRASLAANRLGKACTKSTLGREQLDSACEYTLKALLKQDQRINGLCYLDLAMIAISGGKHAGLWAVAIRLAELAPRPVSYNKHLGRWMPTVALVSSHAD